MAANYQAQLADLLVPPPAPPKAILVDWSGATGSSYRFEVYPIGTAFYRNPGIYIFCQVAGLTTWAAHYVGQTDDFDRRLREELAQHHRWQSIRAAGATHVGVLHVPGGVTERLRIETDLRRSLNPPCNRQ